MEPNALSLLFYKDMSSHNPSSQQGHAVVPSVPVFLFDW